MLRRKKVIKVISRIVVATMIFALTISGVSAATVAFSEVEGQGGDIPPFGSGNGGRKAYIGPRGFAIDTNLGEAGGVKWLKSNYRNNFFWPVYMGENYIETDPSMNVINEPIEALAPSGDPLSYPIQFYIDKNPYNLRNLVTPTFASYVKAFKDGSETEVPKTPLNDTNIFREHRIADAAGQPNRFIGYVNFSFEPGHKYEFAFKRAIQSNNNATAALSKAGDGYIQDPGSGNKGGTTVAISGDEEREWYLAGKDKEVEFREYRYNYKNATTTETTENPNWGKFRTMRFSLETSPTSTSITATPSGRTTIRLVWQKKEDVQGYRVYRSETENGSYTKVAEIKSNNTVSYLDKNLGNEKNYYYKVRGIKTYGGTTYESQDSNKVTAKTLPAVWPESVLEDKGTGVKISAGEDVLPPGTTMEVNPLSIDSQPTLGKGLELLTAVDIVLKDDSGNPIQPEGKVSVTVNVPKGNIKEFSNYYAAYINGADTELMSCLVDKNNSTFSFETSHFSKYGLVGSNTNQSLGKVVATGDASNLSIPMIALIISVLGLGITILIRRKKA